MKNKLIYTIVRVFAGLMFTLFGAMKFFPMPEGSLPEGGAGTFSAALEATGYFMPFLAVCEVIIGIMLLFNLYPALATIMLVPISLNIFLFELAFMPAGWYVGMLPIILNAYLVYYFVDKYKSLLQK